MSIFTGIVYCSRTAAIIFLACAVAAGSFSFLPTTPNEVGLELLAQPRYAGLLLAVALGRWAGYQETAAAQPATVVLVGLISTLTAYSLLRTWIVPHPSLQWSDIEPVVLSAATVLCTAWLVRSPAEARVFLFATALSVAAAALLLAVRQVASPSPLPVAPFYASRMFFVGALVTLFLASDSTTRTARYSLGLLGALFLLYMGLASGMRAAALLYAAALAVSLLLLAARQQYRVLLTLLAVAAAAYGGHIALNGQAAAAKFRSYAPTITRDDAPKHAPDIAACLDRVRTLAGERSLSPSELRHTCDRFFVLDDRDARIRLALHAFTSNHHPALGSGLGAYEFIDAARPDSPAGRYTYPHNIVGEVYHATGAAGGAVLAAAIFLAAIIALRASLAATASTSVLLSVFVFTAAAALLGGDLYDNRFLWIMPIVMSATTGLEAPSSR